LVNVLHKQYNEKEEQIFILDFGGALFDCRDCLWSPLISIIRMKNM